MFRTAMSSEEQSCFRPSSSILQVPGRFRAAQHEVDDISCALSGDSRSGIQRTITQDIPPKQKSSQKITSLDVSLCLICLIG